jgi:predicted hydrocarbon binding protein
MISSFFKKLLLSRRIEIDNGRFKVFDKNFLLGSLQGFVFLREELKKQKSTDTLYKFGEEISKEIYDYIKKFGGGKEEILRFWLNMVNMSGFGSIEIIEAKDKELQAIVNCINSPMAEYYFKTLKKSEAADEMLAGIIGGFFSQWFEKPVVCEEITCMAKGGRYCQFKVSSKK